MTLDVLIVIAGYAVRVDANAARHADVAVHPPGHRRRPSLQAGRSQEGARAGRQLPLLNVRTRMLLPFATAPARQSDHGWGLPSGSAHRLKRHCVAVNIGRSTIPRVSHALSDCAGQNIARTAK